MPFIILIIFAFETLLIKPKAQLTLDFLKEYGF